MKVAILGAMPEEIEPLLSALRERGVSVDATEHANNKFYAAKLNGHDLVIAYSKIGKVNSALTATVMIEKFGARALIFTGVAGALKHGIKIGEILYATALVQHDLDITAFGHPYGFVPGSKISVQTDAKLNSIAQSVAEQLGITLKSGVIASGDQFVGDEERKSWIERTFDASAVEMEGASVAQVCDALGVPFCVLRAISDEAGHKAEFDFDEFMVKSAQTSANFVLKMIERL